MRPGPQEERWAELWSQEEKPLRLAPGCSPVVCRAIWGQGPGHSGPGQAGPSRGVSSSPGVITAAPAGVTPRGIRFSFTPRSVPMEPQGPPAAPPGSVAGTGAWKETGAAWGDRWASSLGRVRGGPGGTPGRPALGHRGLSSTELGKRERARSE